MGHLALFKKSPFNTEVADIQNQMGHMCIDKRWHPGLNWGMEALQASALPLGYATGGDYGRRKQRNQ